MQLGCRSFRRCSRRRFLQVGGTGLFDLTFADLPRARETSPAVRAKQAIFVFLTGGPPQQDTFDLKPDQPAEIRSPFRPISTAVPGLEVCEHLPQLAKTAKLYSVLRSVTSRGWPHAADHRAGLSWKTGNPRALRGTPKFPMFGSVVSKLVDGPVDLPDFVALGDIESNAPDLRDNFLGPAFDPLYVEMSPRDPRTPDLLAQMLVPRAIEAADFERNVDLVRSLDAQSRRLDQAGPLIAGLDRFRQKAFDVLRSPRLRDALDWRREPAAVRKRYRIDFAGYAKVNYMRQMLAARRLIEVGVPFVYVDLPYWDWHGGVLENEQAAMRSLAGFDASLRSLLTDLDERGPLESTLVVALGEMGRTPKMNKNGLAARDHWSGAQFVLVAGGGTKAGEVVGATDSQAAYVKDKEYSVASFGRTLYHLLGIDPEIELHTTDARPLKLITEPAPLIREIFA